MLFKKNTIYYPGCLTKYVLKDIANNYVNILNKFGVKFAIIKEKEICCGAPALNNGYILDFKDLRQRNYELFKKNKVGKIITSCPNCYKTFNEHYDLKVEHITQTLAHLGNKLPLKYEEDITYYDSCILGRQSGIYEEPRKVLDLLGFNIKELEFNRRNSICCGGGGNLKANLPNVADKMALRVLKFVKTKKLVTACPMCYIHLKQNAPKGLEVYELSQLIL